jgi:two-component system chemotaxis response regulator CheY
MRFLVVEDEFVSRRVLTRFLEAFGSVEIAVDGLEAMEAVKVALDENDPYAVICLDVMMPRLDGQGTLRQIRKMERARGVKLGAGAKIVMVTGLNDSQTVMSAFRGDSDAFLVKPVDHAKLLETLAGFGIKPLDKLAA